MQILSIGGPYSTAPVNAPTSLSAVPATTTATISFTAPTNDGGSPITNYEYSFNGSSWTALSPADSTSPIVVSGLTSNTTYTIYLRAVNSVGSGPSSTGLSVTTVSGAPTGLSATATTTTATISFSAPSGTATISNYQYSFNGASWTALSPADAVSPITISGLSSNTSYTVYLRAVNAAGSGLESAGVAFTTVAVAMVATGGTPNTYTSGGITYKYHVFNGTGNFAISSIGDFGNTITYLIIAGGGGGGPDNYQGWSGAGGGAGGMIESTFSATATTYAMTIGAGSGQGGNGSNSSISGSGLSTITATGGGRGAGIGGGERYNAGNGGSGGGGANQNQYVDPPGTGIAGQGNNGSAQQSAAYAGAGGGKGSAGSGTSGGSGGASSITGTSVTYAGGGGGGLSGAAGSGGGGAGGNNSNGGNGTANTGGGGGGAGYGGGVYHAGGSGGSGVIIVRYRIA